MYIGFNHDNFGVSMANYLVAMETKQWKTQIPDFIPPNMFLHAEQRVITMDSSLQQYIMGPWCRCQIIMNWGHINITGCHGDKYA